MSSFPEKSKKEGLSVLQSTIAPAVLMGQGEH
jgi:hypothetical protein